jgi:hypothetical protein
MADWYGSARTNYVRVTDEAKFREMARFWNLEVIESDGKLGLYPDDGGFGDWPSFMTDDDDVEHEFSFEGVVMPLVAEGEVLITMSCGAEKLRYLTGYAAAYRRVGDRVDWVDISLTQIYGRARQKWPGVTEDNMTAAEY